jgi:hypothetical protein
MHWRLPVAFLVSPVIPCVLFNVPDYVAFHTWSNGFLVGALVVAETLVLLVAVPTFFLLRRYRRVTLITCLTAGFTICFAISCLLVLYPLDSGYSAGNGGGATVINGHLTAHGALSQLVGASVIGLMGALTGLIFWLVGIRGRDASNVHV